MKIKNLLLWTILTLMLAYAVYASFDDPVYVVLQEPNDSTYWIIGEDNLTFISYCAAFTNNNISNGTLWTNISGTWAANYTNATANYTAGSSAYYRFRPQDTVLDTNLTDDISFAWNVRCEDNESNASWGEFNRTIYMEKEPNVTTQTPATGNVSISTSIPISLTIEGDGDYYRCYLYTNRSGSNHSDGEFEQVTYWTVVNNTGYTYSYNFDSGNVTLWNVKCYEGTSNKIYGWATNQTVQIATDTLIVELNYPLGGYITNATMLQVNMTATSSILDQCFMWSNGSWANGTNINYTYTTPTSGTEFTVGSFNGTHGNAYAITIGCNTTESGITTINATTLNFIVDLSGPGWDTFNNHTIENCTKLGIDLTANESLDSSTLYYRKHGTTTWSTDTYTTNGTDRLHNITFDQETEQIYEYNLSMTDLAGNVNSSSGLSNLTTPLGVCTGWSLYSLWNDRTLGDLETDIIVTDYIYYWNQSNQSWVYKLNGTAAKENITLWAGNAVWLYTSMDGLWYRDTTATHFEYNISNGHNYMGLSPYTNYTFGNVSFRSMRNDTGGLNLSLYDFLFEDFASWNNTGKEWESYFYNFSWNNNTQIGKNTSNGLDAIWIYSPTYNLTYNSSMDYIALNRSLDID